MNAGVMNSCLVTRKENSIELEDYSMVNPNPAAS